MNRLCFGTYARKIMEYTMEGEAERYCIDSGGFAPRSRTQEAMIEALYGCLLYQKDTYATKSVLPAAASNLLKGAQKVPPELITLSGQPWAGPQACQYFRERIMPNLTDVDELCRDLLDLLRSNHGDHRRMLELEECYRNEEAPEHFLSQLYLYSLQLPNKLEPGAGEQAEQFATCGDDPYAAQVTESDSTALRIETCLLKPEERRSFHSLERCLDHIKSRQLQIDRVDVGPKGLKVLLSKSCYHLRRIEEGDNSAVHRLIQTYLREFVPKTTWRGRALSDMVYDGLSSQKWTGYAFFDQDQNLVSYLDYKIRMDTCVELGTALTRPEDRRKRLSLSLVWLFRLQFAYQTCFTGTYEGNDRMRKLLDSAGFQIAYYKQDRVEDESRILNQSVYYSAPPLLAVKEL